MNPIRPKCLCIECRSYSLVYDSVTNVHRCVDCDSSVSNVHIEEIIHAFGVYMSAGTPVILPKYNAIRCISCLKKGGIEFKSEFTYTVYCGICKYRVVLSNLHEMIVNAFKTKLLEKNFNFIYSSDGEE